MKTDVNVDLDRITETVNTLEAALETIQKAHLVIGELSDELPDINGQLQDIYRVENLGNFAKAKITTVDKGFGVNRYVECYEFPKADTDPQAARAQRIHELTERLEKLVKLGLPARVEQPCYRERHSG